LIYLILDTNIWLYLANGLNPITEKDQGNLHFELLQVLKDHKQQGDIKILINDIILKEWKRNKEHTKYKIKKLQNKLDNVEGSFKHIKKYVESSTDKIQKEYAEGLKKEINSNKKHIQNVENFLHKDCDKIQITKEQKLQIFDLAITNKAPFHNNKNNIADASILFSAADYLNEKLTRGDTEAIFVSNNITDFTDGNETEAFHPGIVEALNGTKIKFKRILPTALELSKELIIQIEEFQKEAWLERNSFNCRTPFCESSESFTPFGYLDKEIEVKYESDEVIDPDQIDIFPSLPTSSHKGEKIKIGDCVLCGTPHFKCPECGELIYISDEETSFSCHACSTIMKLENEDSGELYLLVNDVNKDFKI